MGTGVREYKCRHKHKCIQPYTTHSRTTVQQMALWAHSSVLKVYINEFEHTVRTCEMRLYFLNMSLHKDITHLFTRQKKTF